MIIPLLLMLAQSGISEVKDLFYSSPYWIFIFFYSCIYFLLSLLIMPYCYARRRWVCVGITAAVLMAATLYVQPFDRLIMQKNMGFPGPSFHGQVPGGNMPFEKGRPFPPGRPFRKGPVFDYVSVFFLLLLFLLMIMKDAIAKSKATEQRAIQAEVDRANAELAFLKAQINPHFLFNTLNNIYALTVTKSDRAPGAVMKLSQIMRYITDEADETMVPLQDELDCIKNYIGLQQLRLGEDFPIQFTVEGDLVNKQIPPLVLMTFVENAFKHGVSNHEQAAITISVSATSDSIRFASVNKLFSSQRNQERTGVGIENTKKRLEVLYDSRYSLQVKSPGDYYTVELILHD